MRKVKIVRTMFERVYKLCCVVIIFKRDHKLVRKLAQIWIGHATCAAYDDFQFILTFLILKGKCGRSLKIISNLALKVGKKIANCSWSVNRKPFIHHRISKQINKKVLRNQIQLITSRLPI